MTGLQAQTAKAIVNIFETGRVAGDYSAVTLLAGDRGHLTYGRNQTTLESGNLFLLVKAYCDRADARFASELRPFLTALAAADFTLDGDLAFQNLLRNAGADAAMRAEQDRFFDAQFLIPACRRALALGIQSALGQTIVYDSYIQGGFARIAARVAAVCGSAAGNEQAWIGKYIAFRKEWLASLGSPLSRTIYRMDCFSALTANSAWELPLSLTVRGVVISEQTLADAAMPVRAVAAEPTDAPSPRILRLSTPPLRGADVARLETALAQSGFPCLSNGVFDSDLEGVVKRFQEKNNLKQDGIVGPLTRQALGV